MQKNKALETYLQIVADQVECHTLIARWTMDKGPKIKSLPNRIMQSIRALELAGYNVSGKDWIEATRSTRFREGKETVARILAYPDAPGMSCEPMKLAQALGIDRDTALKDHDLACGISFSTIPEEQISHAIWYEAAKIAQEFRLRLRMLELSSIG